ncbi:MAG: response regulator [Labilithrix sp.]|nr:response regulator [Labilithrix sp.]
MARARALSEELRSFRARHATASPAGEGDDVLAALRRELEAHREELALVDEELQAQVEELARLGDRLTKEKRRYHELFELAPDAYFVTDRSLIVREANAGACTMLGVELRSLRGKPLLAVVEPDHVDALDPVTREALAGETRSVEVPLTAKGEHVWVELQVRASEEGSRLLWIARDVTARRERTAAIEETAAALEERVASRTGQLTRALRDKEELLARERALREEVEAGNRAKDRFLAILSHDLRGPLNAVLGWTSLLRRELLDTRTREQALLTIERNARIQAELIDGLLDVSRISGGKMQLDMRTLDLVQVVRGVFEATQPAADEKGVSLVDALGDVPLVVLGDAGRLRQIVSNLLMNAVKFTPSGGRVTLDLTSETGCARLRVSDTGCGISAAVLPEIFEAYRQGSDPSVGRGWSGGQAGLGLGLFIVRHLVEMHRGRVDAASEGEGKGAVFTVLVPLLDARRAAEHVERTSTTALPALELDLEGVRVLLVEDEVDTRDVLAMSLRRLGADVVTAADAETAVQVFDAFDPNILVSDIGLPFADGRELIKRIRASEGGTDVAALAVSGYASSDDARRALDAGFDAHVPKPVSADELIDAIASIVRSRR